ncbi:MAG: hypothetical protein ACI9U2_002599, partial [Bradymonadia bacterium]
MGVCDVDDDGSVDEAMSACRRDLQRCCRNPSDVAQAPAAGFVQHDHRVRSERFAVASGQPQSMPDVCHRVSWLRLGWVQIANPEEVESRFIAAASQARASEELGVSLGRRQRLLTVSMTQLPSALIGSTPNML